MKFKPFKRKQRSYDYVLSILVINRYVLETLSMLRCFIEDVAEHSYFTYEFAEELWEEAYFKLNTRAGKLIVVDDIVLDLLLSIKGFSFKGSTYRMVRTHIPNYDPVSSPSELIYLDRSLIIMLNHMRRHDRSLELKFLIKAVFYIIGSYLYPRKRQHL